MQTGLFLNLTSQRKFQTLQVTRGKHLKRDNVNVNFECAVLRETLLQRDFAAIFTAYEFGRSFYLPRHADENLRDGSSLPILARGHCSKSLVIHCRRCYFAEDNDRLPFSQLSDFNLRAFSILVSHWPGSRYHGGCASTDCPHSFKRTRKL